ncbi:MAG: hypothetical protein ACRC80_12070 [Waterburya sp.]
MSLKGKLLCNSPNYVVAALNPSNAEIAIATSRITEAEATGKTSLATLASIKT